MKKKKTSKKDQFSIQKIDFVQAATRTGGLGLGGISAGILNNVLVRKLPATLADKAFIISNGVTALGGVLISEGAVGEGDFLKAFGDGMATMAAVNLASSAIPTDLKLKLGIEGIGAGDSYGMPIPEYSILRGIKGPFADDYNEGEVFNQAILSGLEDAYVPIVSGNIIS